MSTLQIQSGQVVKTGPGTVQVNFAQPFTVVPLVFLTPNFPNNPITFVDAVINVTVSSFTITSPNAAPNYFVNWLAMTPGVFTLEG